MALLWAEISSLR